MSVVKSRRFVLTNRRGTENAEVRGKKRLVILARRREVISCLVVETLHVTSLRVWLMVL